MSELQNYTAIATYIDGRQLVESTETTVSIQGNHIDNMTEAKGFAGQSLGASIIEATIQTVIPAGGFEFDPSESVIKNVVHELTVFIGGKTLTTKGYFTSFDPGKAVNAEARATMNFKGSPTFFE